MPLSSSHGVVAGVVGVQEQVVPVVRAAAAVSVRSGDDPLARREGGYFMMLEGPTSVEVATSRSSGESRVTSGSRPSR